MIWSEKLFVSESIREKEYTYKYRVERAVLCPQLYLISIASNDKNLLDVIEQKELLQKAYPKSDLRIVGMAKGYGEALELVSSICTTVLEETESLNIKQYFFHTR